MANPFPCKFDSQCQNCGNYLDAGEEMYAHDQMFICADCANEADAVCECGNYKKPEFKTCFTCKDIAKDFSANPDDWNPWDEPKTKKDDSLPF